MNDTLSFMKNLYATRFSISRLYPYRHRFFSWSKRLFPTLSFPCEFLLSGCCFLPCQFFLDSDMRGRFYSGFLINQDLSQPTRFPWTDPQTVCHYHRYILILIPMTTTYSRRSFQPSGITICTHLSSHIRISHQTTGLGVLLSVPYVSILKWL